MQTYFFTVSSCPEAPFPSVHPAGAQQNGGCFLLLWKKGKKKTKKSGLPTLAISVPQYLMFFFTPSPAPCSGGLCKNPTFHFKKKRKRNRQFTGLQVLEKTREVQAQYTLKHHLSSEVKYCGNNFFFFFFFILKEVFLFLKGKILSLFWSILLS